MEKESEGLNWKISYGLAVLSGILLLLSLPPFKFGGFLAWVAFVPILIAVFYETKAKRVGRLTKIVALGALPICLWAAWWVTDLLSLAHLEHLFWLWFIIGLALAIVLTQVFYGDFISDYWKPKYLPSKNLSYLPLGLQLVALPLIWTGTEFLALNIPGVMRIGGIFGFWSIAKMQWLNPPILNLASFTGMYGVTFLVLLVNCAIAYGIIHYREVQRISKAAIGVLVVFAAIFSYGWVTVPPPEQGDITATIIQIPRQEEDPSQHYLDLSEKSLRYDTQFVIWPFLLLKDLDVESHSEFAQAHNVYLVGNAVVSPTGDIGHHTMGYHFVTIPNQIGEGDIKGIFFPKVQGIDTEFGIVGTVDCIESGSTLPTNDLVNKGVQFLIVPTGSPNVYVFSWALGTNAIYRAAEHHMFAACVIGDHAGSMLIDPYGRIIDDVAPEPEIVAGKMAFTDERTFYTKHGDIFGWTIAGFFIVLIGYNLFLKRRSPYVFCKKCRAQIERGTKVCPECGKKQR